MKTFVEIGCNEFNTLNYLGLKGWRGFLIDPVQIYLDNLADVPNITKVCTAICDTDGIIPMRVFEQEWIDKDRDLGGMGSITTDSPIHDPENIGKTKIIEVKGTKFSTFCKEYNIEHIDYLKIDTEGYDLKILKFVFDYGMFPSIIKAEHAHLYNYFELEYLLESNNYHVEKEENDIYAIKL
jgi:FkbM family methyltransferase